MECDRGDSFPVDLKPNGIPFGSKLKGKLSHHIYKYRTCIIIRSNDVFRCDGT